MNWLVPAKEEDNGSKIWGCFQQKYKMADLNHLSPGYPTPAAAGLQHLSPPPSAPLSIGFAALVCSGEKGDGDSHGHHGMEKETEVGGGHGRPA